MPNLTDLNVVRDICARHDFAMSKGFGQNFIVNAGIPPRMAEASGVGPDWGVLEIGPGIGVLTKELALRAKKVVALEVDNRLPPILEETLAEFDNVKIILEDALKCDLAALMAREFSGMRVAVCANLPYYITSPILMRLLEAHLPVENITVMVQKEAAQRITAQPGTAVKKDDEILVMEAMKMEMPIKAPQDGVIASINVGNGDKVNAGDVLATL